MDDLERRRVAAEKLGLDADYIADAARGIWHYTSRGNFCELAYTPGNGTLYELTFLGCAGINRASDWMDNAKARSITADRPELRGERAEEWLLLGWLGHGLWPVDLRSVWHDVYLVEKFADCTHGDAQALRALLLAIADAARLRPVAVLR